MLSIISISLFAFITCFSCVLTFRPIAIGVGLVDKPNGRKQHNGEIPIVGGLAIYIAVIFSSFLFVQLDSNYTLYLISTSFMVLIGALDDFYDLDAGLRLIAQFLIASLMVFGANLYISDLGDLFGNGGVQLGVFSQIFTLLAVVAAINAFNMMDGVDGLVGTLSINAFISIAFLAFVSEVAFDTELPAIFLGAIIAFLFFNFGVIKKGKYKIFMGDAGSMLIGLTIIWLLTYSTQTENSIMKPISAVWIIAVPIIDMFSVMLRRISAGYSPLRASRDHLHHFILSKGFDNRKTTLIIGFGSAVFSVFGIITEMYQVTSSTMMIVFILIFSIYHFFLSRQDKLRNVYSVH